MPRPPELRVNDPADERHAGSRLAVFRATTMKTERDRTWAVILAGGEGTRLSSLTSALYGQPMPKQFAALDGARSMLQATVARVEQIVPRDRIIVVIGPKHTALARAQLGAFNGITLLIQPASLGTAVAILYGVAWIRAHDHTSDVLVFPSDHYVADEHGFLNAARAAVSASRKLDRIVLVGTAPDAPDPDYGWVVPGAVIEPGVTTVGRFVEKPDRELAERLQRDGGLWNTFVFAAPIATLDHLVRSHLPVHAERFAAWASGGGSIREAFDGLAPADFSRDLLQQTTELAVVAMTDVGWNDWGTPARVLASLRGKPSERRLRECLESQSAAVA